MNYDERPINIIYYICINPKKQWGKIIESQLIEMHNSGILKSAVLHIEVCCEFEDTVKLVEDFIGNYFNEKKSCIYFVNINTENNYEYQGINKLYNEACNNPDKIFIYIHSKGMFFSDANNDASRENKILTKYTFNKWKDLIVVLLDRNHSITAAFNGFMNRIYGEPHYEEYLINIYTMFIKYENSTYVRNI